MTAEVEILKNYFSDFCRAGVFVEFGGVVYKDPIEVEQAFNVLNINDLSFFLKDRYHGVYYRLGFGYNDSDVFNAVGYPWKCDLMGVFKGFSNGIIPLEDYTRFFELQKQSIDSVLAGKKTLSDKFNGSDKWKSYFNDMCEDFKKVIDEALRKVSVENMEIIFGHEGRSKAVCKFHFSGDISYAQKKRLKAFLDAKYLPRYQKINGDLKSIFYMRGFYSEFNDNGKKCDPCNAFIIQVESNNWAALGLDETSQFVPRMGMKKHLG